MRVFAAVVLVLLLIAVPVVASQSALSFAVECCAGTLAAAVPFYAVLFRTHGALAPEAPRLAEPATEDVLLGLAMPPLMAGATVASVGRLFGGMSNLAGFASILGAYVGETFALRAWELNLPEWLKAIAVPAITSLAATIAFDRQAGTSP